LPVGPILSIRFVLERVLNSRRHNHGGTELSKKRPLEVPMILSSHDSDRSFSARFRKSGELDQMAVQIDPPDIFQFCVMQESGQVVSHGANNTKACGIVTKHKPRCSDKKRELSCQLGPRLVLLTAVTFVLIFIRNCNTFSRASRLQSYF
jgi:hypothetical protein